MKLLVGLGNAGSQYEKNRHNVGFLYVNYLLKIQAEIEKAFSSVGQLSNKFQLGNIDVRTFRTMDYMNNSGNSVSLVMKYYNVEPKDLIVVHDEIDLEFGEIRSKIGGGENGHNGLRSITKMLGTPLYKRIRVGVGRPNRGSVADFVLSNFTKLELEKLDDIFIDIDKQVEKLLE